MTRSANSATQERDLRAGRSVWEGSDRAHVARKTLRSSQKVDVAIVGGGISGAFMAHALAGRFERIVVLDRRAPCQGSTTASTALLQYEIDTPLIELSEKIGPIKARRAWLRSWRATQQLIQLVHSERILCGLEEKQSLYLSGNRLGHRALRDEALARKRAGLESYYLTAKELASRFGLDREGAILSNGSASANPVQLAAGLLRRAARSGVTIYSPVRVRDVMATAHGVVLDAGDRTVEAKHCVFCTGYEFLKSIPSTGVNVTSSWATATRPDTRYPDWLDSTLIWEASEPYLYLRTTPDHRILIGGEDERDGAPKHRADAIPRKTKALEAKLHELIPEMSFSVSKGWAGAFGESRDGLPIIDSVPGLPNCYAVMGVGGNGTIYSLIAAQIISRQLGGHPDPDRGLFKFR